MSSTNSTYDLYPLLETSRFVIRAFDFSDLVTFAQYRADEDLARYQSWSNYTYRDALQLFDSMDYSNFGKTGSGYQLAIVNKTSRELVGDLAVHFIGQEQVEIGFTIASVHQRKGIGFEALTALLDFLFITLNKQKVVAFVDIKNKPSYKLLEKVGFKKSAQLDADFSLNAGWGDEYFYVKLHSMHCP